MDEATSSVDSRTDANVQETIRREFVNKGVTVLTVAHRLDTVLGYDKIAVLGAGNIVEYGSPSELLEKRTGEFSRLVMQDRRNKKSGAKKSEEIIASASVWAQFWSRNDGTTLAAQTIRGTYAVPAL